MVTKLRKFITRDFKILFYSLSLTLGVYISIQELHKYKNQQNFLIFSLLLFLIFISEIYLTWLFNTSNIQTRIKFKKYRDALRIMYRVSLPVLLYFSMIGYGYYNLDDHSLIIVLALIFPSIFILFVNLRAVFRYNEKIEHKTEYVFDIIKFIIFFTSINTLANQSNNYPEHKRYFVALVWALSFVIFVMMMWKLQKVHFKSLLFSLSGASIISAIFYYIHTYAIISPFQASLVLLIFFYFISAIIHHKLDGTLKKDILLEYLMISLLILTIVYGIY